MEKEKILKTLMSINSGTVRPQAARGLECSEKTLQKWMNLYDIKLRDYKPKKIQKRKGWGANKLNSHIAKQIRIAFYDNEIPAKDLAKKYKVTQASIYRILSNKTYREISAKISGEAQVNVEHNA